MGENLRAARNGYGTQAVLLALARRGLTRKEAYQLVQGLAHQALEDGSDLEELLLQDPAIREHLSEDEIRDSFDLEMHTRHVDYLLRRAGITE